MASNSDIFLNKVLGEDFLESLSKTELWKPGTKSVVDIEDMRIGLKIVPRTIMSFLVRELSSMNIGDNKQVRIPVNGNATLYVTKHERDQFSGDITHDNKKVVDFKFRSIPGVGLVIMSAFELYNVDDMDKAPKVDEGIEHKIQKMIDERIALHDLVERVVEKKLAQKEAIQNMMLMKLTEEIKRQKEVEQEQKVEAAKTTTAIEVSPSVVKSEPKPKSKKPLAAFLEKKKKPKEFFVHMQKGEEVNCPDCGKNLFENQVFSGCICYGEDMDKKVFIKKSENGVKIRFSRSWAVDNIEMLLEVLRKKSK